MVEATVPVDLSKFANPSDSQLQLSSDDQSDTNILALELEVAALRHHHLVPACLPVVAHNLGARAVVALCRCALESGHGAPRLGGQNQVRGGERGQATIGELHVVATALWVVRENFPLCTIEVRRASEVDQLDLHDQVQVVHLDAQLLALRLVELHGVALPLRIVTHHLCAFPVLFGSGAQPRDGDCGACGQFVEGCRAL
mmetsp:Transcript_8052/g.20687  ORF Transcript_8052/g.20687 Transcript_8052/m.20687 type:complete len:200 (-) Transcript_8052:18-617(-)